MIRKTPIAITLAIVIKDRIQKYQIYYTKNIRMPYNVYVVFATKDTNKDFQKMTSQRMHQVLLKVNCTIIKTIAWIV